jgi:hypothetical protein
MKNEILEEIWRVKDALAAKYNYNIEAMFRDLREREKTSGHRYVDLSKPRRKAGTKKAAHA